MTADPDAEEMDVEIEETEEDRAGARRKLKSTVQTAGGRTSKVCAALAGFLIRLHLDMFRPCDLSLHPSI